MATTRNPRHGSMQFWPRKKAKRAYARVRSYARLQETKLLGFAGYKAGMTHMLVTDNRQNALTKGETVSFPVTVIECPPLKLASIRLYKNTEKGLRLITELFSKGDKGLERKLRLPKKAAGEKEAKDFDDVRVLVYTQPRLAGIGKKTPEIFELALGGKSAQEKFEYAKSLLGKDIRVNDVLSEGQQVDVYAVTRGKGFQGPVKRFGVSIRSHKSEKTKRGPGNVGPWTGNRSWTVAHAGQMGFQNRCERNKFLMKISEKGSEVNPNGGFLHYGIVKNSYVLVKGSVQGAAKRLVRLNYAQRPNHKMAKQAPTLEYLSIGSKQGN